MRGSPFFSIQLTPQSPRYRIRCFRWRLRIVDAAYRTSCLDNIMLRSIADIARSEGEDLSDPQTALFLRAGLRAGWPSRLD